MGTAGAFSCLLLFIYIPGDAGSIDIPGTCLSVCLTVRVISAGCSVRWTHPSLWMSTHIGTLEGKFIGTISQIE